MSSDSVVRRLLRACAALLLVGLAWWAVLGGYRSWPRARTFGQQAETIIQLACGMLSAAVVATRFRWGRYSRRVRTAWFVSLAAAAGLSALVWGPPMPLIALAFAGAALLAAWGVVRALGPWTAGPGA